PLARPLEWLADSYNLVGLHVDPAHPPTFGAYFAPSPAHAGGSVYHLNAAGHWEAITNPAAAPIQPGTAYWVFCKGSSTYPGPIAVTLEQAGRIDFGRQVTEQVVRIENHTSVTRQIELRPQASAAPPVGQPASAGDVPLSYWNSSVRNYVAVSGPFTLSLAAGGQAALRMAVRRAGLDAGVFQSLLELRDGAGTLLKLPVVATGSAGAGATSSLRTAAADTSNSAFTGLWVG